MLADAHAIDSIKKDDGTALPRTIYTTILYPISVLKSKIFYLKMQMLIYTLNISYNIIYLSFERKYTLFNKVENKNGDRNVGCKYNYIILISVFRPSEVSSSKTVKSKKDNISVFP